MDQPFTNMEEQTLLAVTVLALSLVCCFSCCLYCVCGIKGSYDDLYSVVSETQHLQQQQQNNNNVLPSQPHSVITSSDITTPLISASASTTGVATDESNREDEPDLAVTNGTTQSIPSTNNLPTTMEEQTSVEANEDIATADITTADTAQSTINRQLTAESDLFYPAMEEENPHVAEEEIPLLSSSSTSQDDAANHHHTDSSHAFRPPPISPSSSKHMRRIISVCSCLYMMVVVLVLGTLFVAVRFYPKIPAYSVCNDDVAWSKVMESMVHFRSEIDIEILMSLENANHVDVFVDEGYGMLQHQGFQVGHYIVPPVSVTAMAITDVMIIATLTPDRHQAVALATDYYKNKLVLDVNIDLVLRVPTLFNYSREFTIADRPVPISQEEDRHLCACKEWKNDTTIAFPSLLFHEIE